MINELYEVALSEDGTVYGPFEAFVPGDVRLLSNFAKFRVTTFGDFEEDDYRVRGFSGIVDDATTTSGGFGISPFGKFPFGDGGICLEASGIELEGTLTLSGELTATVPQMLATGDLSLSGELDVLVEVSETGSLALSGSLTTIATSSSLPFLSQVGRNAIPFKGNGNIDKTRLGYLFRLSEF